MTRFGVRWQAAGARPGGGPPWAGLAAALTALCIAGPAPAQAPEPAPAEGDAAEGALELRLDSLAEAEGACRVTLVVRNGLAADIEALGLEAVALGPDGGVARLALFDLGRVPEGRMRVRQFDLPNLRCDGIAAVLVNGVERCEGPGLAPASCERALSLTSRISAELL
jgi:hypothetical protein